MKVFDFWEEQPNFSDMWYILAVLTLHLVLPTNVVRGTNTPYISCDFESSTRPMGSFYQDNQDDFDWKRDTANTQTSFTRPTADHTFSNRSGHYVFIESRFPPRGAGKISRLMSPTVFQSSSVNHCVQFYYHMYGPPSQKLHVFVRQHEEAIPEFSHWNRSGDLGDVWHKHMLNITVDGGFQVIFEATKGSDFHGDISLDDISISDDYCEQENAPASTAGPNTPPSQVLNHFECNMDMRDLCGITQDPRNGFNWKWRGNSSLPDMGPLGDHTHGSTSGFYMFAPKGPTNQNQEQRSRIISPVILRNTAHKCLRFYYFMNGNNVGQLNGYILLDNLTLPLDPTSSYNKSVGNVWQPGFMDIPPQQANYKVVFEVIRGKDYDGSVAIDDLVLSNNLCPTVNASTDFESGLNDFIQDDTDDRNWVMRRGRTPSYYTGPSNDHTYGNSSGQFLYIETSYWWRTQGHAARLLSPPLLKTTTYPRCLTFWYHMFGADVETLLIYIINGTNSDKHDVLWSRSGNRGNKWRAAEVHLNSTVDFQVVFEAQQGRGYRGDIAIDDIKIEGDVCPGEHHYHNYPSITCDFEELEICYYQQDDTDDIDWSWENSDSSRSSTAPSADHTTNNDLGFYVFVSYGYARRYPFFAIQTQTARLLTPYAKPQKVPSCLEFWYFMYGRDTEKLNVYVQKENEDLPKKPSWTKSGDQGRYWHRGTIDINVIDAQFRIVFEGTNGRTYRDTIAIDDVTFFNSSSCPPFTTSPAPPVTLPPTRNNASCNFEDMYICNYTQVIEDDSDWSRRQKNRYWWYRYHRRFTGPARDHTLNTDEGYYMNFDCGWWTHSDGRAQMATPYLANHSEPRCLHFYYYMFGRSIDFLNLYVVPFGYTLPVDPTMAIYGNKGDAWQHGMLALPPSSDPYRVFFEATKGLYNYGDCDIAIDDITFTQGVCPDALASPAPATAGNCDFEPTDDHLCGYKQEAGYAVFLHGRSWPADEFDWSLNAGNTSTAGTGPTTDHTLGTNEGHYLYIESSLPKRPKMAARIISPIIEGSKENICVQFYCHMKGDGIGNLRLLWRPQNSDEKELLKLWGEQGDDWRAQTVELEAVNTQFELVFEATIGNIPNGDIAIDDITILREPCQGHLKESMCTFDVAGDWCGYTQRNQNDFKWEWYDVRNARGDPPIAYQGDRSYIYVRTSAAVQGRAAKMTSRTLDGRSSQHCIEFDYFLSQNSSSSKLTIAVLRNDGDQYNVMTLHGNKETNGWRYMNKTLKKEHVGEKFQVVFIAIAGDGSGVIGLDNPTISLGSCEKVQTSIYAREEKKRSSAVAVFFAILSAILIIVLLAIASLYLYRRYRDRFPALPVRYEVHDENVNTIDKKTAAKDLAIENPLYALEPAVVPNIIINTSDTNGVS